MLGVSRSGYYLWEKHNKSERQIENDRLLVHIRDAYARGRGTYGSPRVTAELKAKGVHCHTTLMDVCDHFFVLFFY